MDIVEPRKRSEMMAGIKSKNTRPEILVRKWLFSKGFRYRVNHKDLPGCPDIVLKKHNTVIFVNGCFFHHHENCKLAYIPKTRTDWWLQKFERNRKRDQDVKGKLEEKGWRVIEIWECQVRNGTFKTILENRFADILPRPGY